MSEQESRKRNGLTYAEAGVSIEAGDALVRRIKPAAARTNRPGVLGGLGGFGGLFDLKAAGFQDPLLVAATDGVGTKLRIGIDTGSYRTLGQDLVAMCVNDLLCQGAEPLFFLDYFATDALDVESAAQVVQGVAHACEIAGCALIGGETAEMPSMYAPGDFDLAGFAVGAVERDDTLPRSAEAGDVIIALASDGAHSNGYSLIRNVVANTGLAWEAPAPFAPDRSLGAALLTPTRIYVRETLALLRDAELGSWIRAAAHVTGGGLTENLPRAFGADLCADIDLASWRAPELFHWLAREGGVAPAEMLRAFNCGVGFALIVAAEAEAAINASLIAAGVAAWRMGVLTSDETESVRYRGELFG